MERTRKKPRAVHCHVRLLIDMHVIEAAASFILTYYVASTVQAVSHRLFGHTDRISAVFESHALGHHGVYKTDSAVHSQQADLQQPQAALPTAK